MDKINALNAIFSNPTDLWIKITENAFTKGPQMISDFTVAVGYYNQEKYEDFGKLLASSVTYFFDV